MFPRPGLPFTASLPTATFPNQSSGEIMAYEWAFGDGVTNTVTNPVYVYTTTGVYTVSLTAAGPGGSDTLTRTSYITATAPEVVETTVITYTYDPLYRLAKAQYSTGEHFQYEYDAVGNRLAMTTSNGSTSYEYDAANRLTSVDGVPYTWDDNGNLLSDGVFTYTYNAAGRMVGAQSVTTTLVYTYTADGLRVAQSVSGVETAFTWDLAAGLAQVLTTSDGVVYLHGLHLIARQQGANWHYYHPDALGSVRQMSDSGGEVVQAYSYTPFGQSLAERGSVVNPFRYTGEWWDADAALLYLRARWYAPGVGRFTRRDVWGGDYRRPLTLNPYLYVLANPVN